ncbi:MAG TPA: hypothetical protein PK069_08635 [Methanolinea sp.]|nr:hypothetical protein [Methanolinea sp.]HQK56212.1 hypothetical protein [Methanolinea sp.]
MLIMLAFVGGVLAIYIAMGEISDKRDDERSTLITRKAGARTLSYP